MEENTSLRKQFTIRVGRGTLSFSYLSGNGQEILFEPYVVKSGVSMAANLREAFKQSDMLQMGLSPIVRVMVDSDVLMVPVEMFSEDTMEEMYHHAFPSDSATTDVMPVRHDDAVCYNVLPDLNSVAVFTVNRDLRTVLEDHFKSLRLISAVSPVWRHLHQRSFTGARQKLYGYFHEQRLEVFAFQQNRFKFCNSFDAARLKDSVYFLLYVWQQLQLDASADELHLVGDIGQEEALTAELRRFVKNVFVINPKADFTDTTATDIKGMPYDLLTLFIKGR